MSKRHKSLRLVGNITAISLGFLLSPGFVTVALAGFDWTPQQVPQETAPMPVMAPTGYGLVAGSGTNLPLSVVLHQLIPPNFTFTTAPELDLSQKVSWVGGRPWPDILQDVLSPIGYTDDIADGNVSIHRIEVQPTVVSVQPEPQPPMNVTEVMPPAPISVSEVVTPPVVISTPPLAPVDQQMSWDAARGTTLRTLLENWADRVQVELYYAADYDYPLEASIHVEGTFEDAVRTLLDGFEHATPQPIGKLHRNTAAGHAVLVVETRGNAYGD